MKGNKKLLVVAVLLLLIAVSYGTYAIYKSSASASNTIKAADWVIEVGDGTTQTDITESNTFTLANITWGSTRYGQNGTIAPGDTGTVTVKIDADGSEVGVHYDITIDNTAVGNSNFTVAAHSGDSLSGNIAYSDTEGEMEATVTLDITWLGVDTASANADDIDLSGHDITLPVTVTVRQNPNPAA